MARTAPARSKRVTVGEQFPTLLLRGLNDEPVQIPDPTGALTHLQFRRFAGCPVCNLHLRSISGRIEEINTAGIREVVVFHSTAAELRKYQDDMPFAVVGDPDKDLYRRFGVEALIRPGVSGEFFCWEGWARGNEVIEAVSRRAEGASGADGGRSAQRHGLGVGGDGPGC